MQEDVEQKTLMLIVNGSKFTGRLLKAAITKYMAYRKEVKLEKQRKREMPVAHRGKQTVKQLTQQNQGVSNIDIQDKEIRQFERIARKYGVDYAVKKDRSTSPPKYMIFFKGRDADAITAAFRSTWAGSCAGRPGPPCWNGWSSTRIWPGTPWRRYERRCWSGETGQLEKNMSSPISRTCSWASMPPSWGRHGGFRPGWSLRTRYCT